MIMENRVLAHDCGKLSETYKRRDATFSEVMASCPVPSPTELQAIAHTRFFNFFRIWNRSRGPNVPAAVLDFYTLFTLLFRERRVYFQCPSNLRWLVDVYFDEQDECHRYAAVALGYENPVLRILGRESQLDIVIEDGVTAVVALIREEDLTSDQPIGVVRL